MARRARRPGLNAAQWFARQSFHTFITHPATGAHLDALLADNEATDRAILAAREEHADDDELAGGACGTACGFCGRCS